MVAEIKEYLRTLQDKGGLEQPPLTDELSSPPSDMRVAFVTSNASKVEWANKRATEFDLTLHHTPLELQESRDLRVADVVKDKARKAVEEVEDPLIVEDRGVYIEALNGFPATYVSLLENMLGAKRIVKAMQGESNRTAFFVSALAYIQPGRKPRVFHEIEEGRILPEYREGDDRGWGTLMHIYSHNTYPNKALSELSDSEWEHYQSAISENDYFTQFCQWLKEKS